MKILIRTGMTVLLLVVFFCSSINAEETFGYSVKTNIVYGKGKITKDGMVVERDLLMDVYTPADLSEKGKWPAVVLVHGGAFHRGGLRLPPFREHGAVHSAMQDWAKFLTPLGYVCIAIEYRLTPELPQPDMAPDTKGLQHWKEAISEAALDRTNYARKAMGLPPVPLEDRITLWNGMLSAVEDLHKAVMKIRTSADMYGIDPDRIAIGGHSAGGTMVLNAAYGIKSPVKAAFPMSPTVVGFDLKKTIDSSKLPPMLVVMSQNDVPATIQSVPPLMDIAKKAGLDANLVWVPGFSHFYPTGAVTLGDDGFRMSVGERVVQFLETHLEKNKSGE